MAEFAVLIKMVTRLRREVTRLSLCLIWRSDNVDILQCKTMEALCRAAMCHHFQLTVILLAVIFYALYQKFTLKWFKLKELNGKHIEHCPALLSLLRPHTRLVICVQLRVSRFRLWRGQCDNVRASGERVESEIISTNSESMAGGGELSRGVIQLLSVISHLEKIVIFRSFKSYRCKMNLHNNICCVSIICNWYLYYICSYILSPSISVVLSLITHDMGCSRYSQGCDHQQSVTILWLNIDSPQPSHDIGTCHVTQTQTMSDVRCLMSRCVSL